MKKRIKIWLVVNVGTLVLRLLSATWRWRYPNPELFERELAGGGVILPFWHNRILTACASPFWRPHKTTVVVSQHTDGEIIAQIQGRFGHGAIRGSATRGGREALDELVAAVNLGMVVGITPDGPRGPKYRCKHGAAVLAERTGRPVIPFLGVARNRKKFRSWDAFELPLPFTEVTLLFGGPVRPCGDAEATRLAIENEMRRMVVEAERLYGREDDIPKGDADKPLKAASSGAIPTNNGAATIEDITRVENISSMPDGARVTS